MYEYANRLAHLGHEVIFYHPLKVPNTNSVTPRPLKKIFYTIRKPPTWFKLSAKIKMRLIPEIQEEYIEDADIIFFTWWAVAIEVAKLPPAKGIKYNLVQDLEFWNGSDDKVLASYRLPNTYQIAISTHIQWYVSKYAVNPVEKILVAIDEKKYHIIKPIEERDRGSICMMYSEEPRKGSIYGIEALKKAKEQVPPLKVTLFGTYEKPGDLPDFIEFVKNPPRLEEIYNNAAIFLGPSLQEGSALPPMEAMMCGCAVICTDIEGHAEYAISGKTAITVTAKDTDAMCHEIVRLVSNPAKRVKIAAEANAFIKKFSWSTSIQRLVTIWEKALNQQYTNK